MKSKISKKGITYQFYIYLSRQFPYLTNMEFLMPSALIKEKPHLIEAY